MTERMKWNPFIPLHFPQVIPSLGIHSGEALIFESVDKILAGDHPDESC